MSNKYIYLSSLDAPSHSDFEVNFPSQLEIKPYSQVRCIACRINPSDNLLEVDESNDLFYVGIDHWNKKNSCVPLLPVYMHKGLFDLEEGDNDIVNLNAEIESQLNRQMQPYAFIRGGANVSISNRKLKLTFDFSIKIDKVLNIGTFDLCVSDDGKSLQIWKGNKLIKSFS